MSCVIGGPNVKIFGKAIQALSRIGDDLYIEAQPTKLLFRTINSSKSAYVCFKFDPTFFIQYTGNSSTKCKVLLKSCIMAFRSLPNLEKTVEKCIVDLLNMEDFLLLQFVCKHAMTKIYHLPYTENESVEATFQKTGFMCKLTASSRLLHDGIQNFTNSVEEITLTICKNKVMLKNYVDDESDPNKVVHTEITLESEEFDTFDVQAETELTFCLKELKAILNFSEGCNAPVTIHCQASGKPITFTIDSLRGLQGDFLLATLAENNTQSTTRSLQRNPLILASQNKDRRNNKSQPSQEQRMPPAMATAVARMTEVDRVPTQATTGQNIELQFDLDDGEDRNVLSPVAEEVVDEDEVPSTPPRKKFRSQFLGISLSQATYTSMAPDPDEVLVPDSDED